MVALASTLGLEPPAGSATRGQIVCLHPGALPTTSWRSLAESLPLGVDVSVLDLMSVRAYWMATAGNVPPTLEQLAHHLRDEVTALPAGPLVLVGWSFGGLLAFELARQVAGYRPVDRLVLLDSIAPSDRFDPDAMRWPEISLWFAMYLCGKKAVTFDPVALPTAPDSFSGLPLLLQWAIKHGLMRPDTSLIGMRKVFDTYVAGLLRNTEITKRYRADPTKTPVVLVKPQHSLLPDHGALGWDGFAYDLTIIPTSGDHYSMLADPSVVSTVAKLLVAGLNDPATSEHSAVSTIYPTAAPARTP